MRRRKSSAILQGVYYVATGALPLLSRRTFERLTGRKRDWWLVQMVGLLAMSIGAALIAGAINRRDEEELAVDQRALAVFSALSFAAIDVAYAVPGRISRIYLLDAVVEAALVVLSV